MTKRWSFEVQRRRLWGELVLEPETETVSMRVFRKRPAAHSSSEDAEEEEDEEPNDAWFDARFENASAARFALREWGGARAASSLLGETPGRTRKTLVVRSGDFCLVDRNTASVLGLRRIVERVQNACATESGRREVEERVMRPPIHAGELRSCFNALSETRIWASVRGWIRSASSIEPDTVSALRRALENVPRLKTITNALRGSEMKARADRFGVSSSEYRVIAADVDNVAGTLDSLVSALAVHVDEARASSALGAILTQACVVRGAGAAKEYAMVCVDAPRGFIFEGPVHYSSSSSSASASTPARRTISMSETRS